MEPTIRLALIPPPARALFAAATRALVFAVLPTGGQQTSRRNAWAGMSSAAARSRARREADLAVRAAAVQAAVRQAAGARPAGPVRRVAEHG